MKANGAAYGYGYNWYLSASPAEPPVKSSRIVQASGIALFADAAQVNTWQAPASDAHPMLEEWYYLDNTTNQPNGHFRHSRRAEVVFGDGHVASERMLAGTLDRRLPQQNVGLLRKEALVLP
jgi:prepilin-type processing-associated H-X9-DG protein